MRAHIINVGTLVVSGVEAKMKDPKFEDLVRGLLLLAQAGVITNALISEVISEVIKNNYYDNPNLQSRK